MEIGLPLHPDFCLLIRNGQLLASQITGTKPPVTLSLSDIELLTESIRTQEVLNPQRTHWINQGLLVNSVNRERAPSIKSLPVKQITPVPCQLNMNFSAASAKDDWNVWSARAEKYFSLKSKELMALCLWSLDANKATNDSFALELYPYFVEAGFLVPTKQVLEQDEEKNTIQLEMESVEDDWQNIEPNGRIPVYFVPHMQNHYPLALGVLYSAISEYNNGSLLEKFQLIPITYMDPHSFLNGPYKKFKEGVWLFSNYMWSMELNMQISQAIKQHSGRNLTIHGGPSTPEYPKACADFMAEFSSVDVAVHGEGEIAIVEVFERISRSESGDLVCGAAMKEVAGITFRNPESDSGLFRTVARKRTAQPDSVPSPYLSGYFDAYGADVEAAIIESNRGCPFGCTFCDWGSATNQKVRKFDLDRVKNEIDWMAARQVRVLWIADANYGLYDRDIELAQYIVDSKKRTGFPQEVVVNYTKNSTWRLVEIIKIFTAGGIISQGIISIQTTDEQTLEVINRKNIKTEKYDELTKVFYDLKLPLSTDLMMGLPGITVEGFNKDLQRYIDMDVSVKAYPTQLLPNSPMADPEYIEKYQIKTDKDNFLISTYSYSETDLHWMKGMYHMYMIADGYGLLRYVIRYLQWEYDILAVKLLGDLLKQVQQEPNQFPAVTWAVRFFLGDKCMPGGWKRFYQQVAQFIEKQYQISKNSGWETVYMVSELSMPDDGMIYPKTQALAHDFTAYFSAKTQKTKNQNVPLTDYPNAQFMVSDPNNMVSIDLNYMQYDSHQYFWELHSDVARPKSTSEFAKEAAAV